MIVISGGNITGQTLITAVDDTIVENLETLEVEILSVIGGADTGSNITGTLSIIDDDNVDVNIAFGTGITLNATGNTTTGTISESGGVATLTVHLSGGTSVFDIIATIAFAGDAVSGTDYTSTVTGDFTVPAGQTSGTFTLSAINNTLFEGNRDVTLTLTTVTGGAQVGMDTVATVTIDDDEVIAPGGVADAMQLWLNAGTGVSGTAPITAWADQSESGNNATAAGNPALTTN